MSHIFCLNNYWFSYGISKSRGGCVLEVVKVQLMKNGNFAKMLMAIELHEIYTLCTMHNAYLHIFGIVAEN